MKKIKAKKNGWVLYTGLYEIEWKNGVAVAVAIEGVLLKIAPQGKKKRKKS